jgi:hypothetical protein
MRYRGPQFVQGAGRVTCGNLQRVCVSVRNQGDLAPLASEDDRRA